MKCTYLIFKLDSLRLYALTYCTQSQLMIKANLSHKPRILSILSESFYENRSIRYVVRQDSKRDERTRRLMDYSYKVCSAFGENWISEDNNACALVLLPSKKKTTFQSIFWDVQLATSVIGLGNVLNVTNREGTIKKHHPTTPFAYLWYIGVDPQHQSKGIGGQLLKELIEEYEQRNLPLYLETSTLRNIPWYKKYGFETYQKIDLSYELFMLRKPLPILTT